MIDPVQLTPLEVKSLTFNYQYNESRKTRTKAHAILLYSQDGFSCEQVSRILRSTEHTVRDWVKDFQKERLASIHSRLKDNQNAAKLTRTQKDDITQVLATPPGDHGLPNEFWDVPTLKSFVQTEFGVVYESPVSYHYLFSHSRYSFHVPATFDRRRDDVYVEKRMAEIRQIVADHINDPDTVILCADECRLARESIVRRAWLPKGKKIILKVTRESKYQNFFGAINLKTGEPYLIKLKWQNQTEIIRALQLLKLMISDKKIILIWDNARFHRGKLIRKRLSRSLSRYHLEHLPPYAPDNNPQEHVWKYGKDKVANRLYSRFEEMISLFVETVMGRTYTYSIWPVCFELAIIKSA